MTSTKSRVMLAGVALSFAPLAWSAQADLTNAKARYEKERAACLSGQTGQEMDACLREAGAALQEARSGKLGAGANQSYLRNALERCDPLPPADAKDCRDRIMGQGSVSGSVEGGGLLREKTTIVPAPIKPAD